jgi:winged helix DNA-binding protein
MTGTLDRRHVLAYRYAAHDLGPGSGRGTTVLATGVQDYPPGKSALLALRLRTQTPPPTVLVHSIRGAMHLHRPADLPRLAAALKFDDGRDLAKESIGPFGAELEAGGIAFGAALDEVAAAMRAAADRTPTKGELSALVRPQVDPKLAPWCAGCGADHVQDQLFRLATLQAGLVIVLDPEGFRYRKAAPVEPADQRQSRAELVRAFLATFGPARPAHLASWLGCTPAAARRWCDQGTGLWTLDAHRGEVPEPRGVRLLPPYDPITELADRALLVPDPAQRRKVWRPAANPGIVLVDGEIAGVWRQRRSRDRLTLRIEPFTELTARHRRAAEADAATIADHGRAPDVELVFA